MPYSERAFAGEPCHHVGAWEDEQFRARRRERQLRQLNRMVNRANRA